MKNCELCKAIANAYCESDQAILCWDCDARVHGANFIVSRHTRSLLCHSCQSPTPWKASGSKLGHTVSVCESCFNRSMMHRGEAEEEDGEIDRVEEEEDYDVEVEDSNDDGDNQVVPWSMTPQPPAASSSSSEETVSRFSGGVLNRDASQRFSMFSFKRMREDPSSSSQNQDSASVSMVAESTAEDEKTYTGSSSLRHWEDRRSRTNRQARVKDIESGPSTIATGSVNKMPFQRGRY